MNQSARKKLLNYLKKTPFANETFCKTRGGSNLSSKIASLSWTIYKTTCPGANLVH